jgi:hypothetical protein
MEVSGVMFGHLLAIIFGLGEIRKLMKIISSVLLIFFSMFLRCKLSLDQP